ncbi:MAG: hypothetical protein J6P21_01215 [Clostridia bacterium]|nr:hypothetical protein [Clostridia bacterium]
MNKKIIVASLLSAFMVSTISSTSAKNGKTDRIVNVIDNNPKVSFAVSSIVSFSLFFGIPFVIKKLNKPDWFKMLGGTQKDIDDYKNLLKNYDKTVDSLTGNAKKAFDEDVTEIDKDVGRSGTGLDEKYYGVLGRILKICALNNNPFKHNGYGQYIQGCNIWCALIIKKIANNSDFISEDNEAKIYFVYKNVVEVLSLLTDENGGRLRTKEDKIYSDLRKNFQNQNKLSDSQIPKLIVDDEGNCGTVSLGILGAFDDFLTENDKMLLIDKLILDATINGGFNPKIALQTMANKVYEIIIKYYDQFLVDKKEEFPNDFDASTYRVLFFQYMNKQIK